MFNATGKQSQGSGHAMGFDRTPLLQGDVQSVFFAVFSPKMSFCRSTGKNTAHDSAQEAHNSGNMAQYITEEAARGQRTVGISLAVSKDPQRPPGRPNG